MTLPRFLRFLYLSGLLVLVGVPLRAGKAEGLFGAEYLFQNNAYSSYKTRLPGKMSAYDGGGFRMAAHMPGRSPGMWFGGSLGYVIGPRGHHSALASGGTTDEYKTTYLRFLVEGQKVFPLTSSCQFRMGIGLGPARGRFELSEIVAGSGSIPSFQLTKEWQGLSWEVSPSIDLFKGETNGYYNVAIFYTSFPTMPGFYNYPKLKWTTYGVRVSLAVGE